MFTPIPVAIGLRYLRAKRRNGFISFISLASILGIALGVAALITTLAVMSGFQREIRDRMLQMAAHATVSGYGEPLTEWQRASDAERTVFLRLLETEDDRLWHWFMGFEAPTDADISQMVDRIRALPA